MRFIIIFFLFFEYFVSHDPSEATLFFSALYCLTLQRNYKATQKFAQLYFGVIFQEK